MRASVLNKPRWAAISAALVLLLAPSMAASSPGQPLDLHARSQERLSEGSSDYRTVERALHWAPEKTAIIICDMWDQHWCRGATERVAEMAPRMNEVLKAARRRGVLIVHAPSDTLKFYETAPQRRRAQEAPRAEAPHDLAKWRSLNQAKEGPLPIDDSDGGCDDDPPCKQGGPWKRQIATLEVMPEDVVSDRGDEVFNVLAQRGIENVIIMGVHTNMCVLGRPFSIRQMVSLGKNVVLMRDMTDTMYNSRRRPFVSHFVGTDLVVGHIERHWCPSITSADFLGGEPFRFQHDLRKVVVFIVAENEYHTWETLPEFAQRDLSWRGYATRWVTASTAPEDWEFSNVDTLRQADMVVVSARRRALPNPMKELLQRHLEAGKPLVGLRTASHAFAVRGGQDARLGNNSRFMEWADFDATVLGGNYSGHHGAGVKTVVKLAPEAGGHPILSGVDVAALEGNGTLYKAGPLRPGAQPLLTGSIPDSPPEPVAWTHEYGPGKARVFYTSLGVPDDFKNPAFRRLLLNGILWSMAERLPPP